MQKKIPRRRVPFMSSPERKMRMSQLYSLLAIERLGAAQAVNSIVHGVRYQKPTIEFQFTRLGVPLQHLLAKTMHSFGYKHLKILQPKKGMVHVVFSRKKFQ